MSKKISSVPPTHRDQGIDVGNVVVGPTVGKQKKKKRQECPKSKAPWEKQTLSCSLDGWIGAAPLLARVELAPKKSSIGGWMSHEEYLAAYTRGTSVDGFKKKIGKFWSPEGAKKKLELAERLQHEPLPAGVFFPTPQKDQLPQHELLFHDPDEVVWCRGSGCFAPRAGCMNRGVWSSKKGKELYHPFMKEKRLLPLFMKASPQVDEDQAIIDAFVVDNLDTGAFEFWDFRAHGWPTVVSAMNIVKRTVIIDENGSTEEKSRLVTDFRYANGVSENKDMSLPSTVSFALKLQEGADIAKQDAKSGFHQLAVAPEHQHLMAVQWRDRVLVYTCAGFGIRNAPEVYTKRTQLAAQEAMQELRKRGLPAPSVVDVYVDDFLQGWRPHSDTLPFIQELLKRGVVLGKKKCIPPGPVQEVLGLVVDAKNRRLSVSAEKLKLLLLEIGLLLRDVGPSKKEHVTTLRVAQILGRLNAVEPALPNVLLLVRPLYEDLKIAIAELNVGEEIGQLKKPRDADHYLWENVPLGLSSLSVESLEYLQRNLHEMNGQTLDLPEENVIISWDASSYAVGYQIRVPSSTGWETIHSASVYMEQLEQDESSLAREAIALRGAVEWMHENRPILLEKAVIRGITDNKGLSCVYWKGSTRLPASLPLIEVVRCLKSHGAVLQSILWLPREIMVEEDGLSKPEGMQPRLKVSQEWFDAWVSSLPPCDRPNVDAFASQDDAKLPVFAGLAKTSPIVDGASHRWQPDQKLWVFPPNIRSLFKKFLKNWKESCSPLFYVCVGTRGWSRIVEEVELEGGRLLEAEPQVILAEANDRRWTFNVYLVKK